MNETKISPDDPRLTAYALGELEGADHAAVEAAVCADPALQSVVEAIRDTARSIEAALAAEAAIDAAAQPSASRSSPWQRAAIIPGDDPRKLDGGPLFRSAAGERSKLLRFPSLYLVIGGLAAACFAVVVALYEPETKRAPEKRYTEVALQPLPAAEEPEPVFAARLQVTENLKLTAITSPAQTPDPEVAVRSPLQGASEVGTGQPAAAMSIGLRSGQSVRSQDAAAGIVSIDGRNRVTDKPRTYFFPADRKFVIRAIPFDQPFVVRAVPYGAYDLLLPPLQKWQFQSGPLWSLANPSGQSSLFWPQLRFGLRDSPAPATLASRTDIHGSFYVASSAEPLSTLAFDVGTTSYADVHRFFERGERPPREAVRIEELLNRFSYGYSAPTAEVPFAASLEVAAAPWNAQHRLVRVGLKAREVNAAARPAASFVFLLDVSSSMAAPDKLPLVKEALRMLVGRLRADDRVAIVTNAAQAELALPSTPAAQTAEIMGVIDGLAAGGPATGTPGWPLAFQLAQAGAGGDGVSRVILCTDGDGVASTTGQDELGRRIADLAKSGVALTVLGFGRDNRQDAALAQLADWGHGRFNPIDSAAEARRVLVEQADGLLATVAKDVTVQVEFNPAVAATYRLIGYENGGARTNNGLYDPIATGEIGAGRTVTALYEVVPAGAGKAEGGKQEEIVVPGAHELLTVTVNYKEPDGTVGKRLEFPLTDRGATWAEASADYKFASAVAGFGLILRDSPDRGTVTLADVTGWARQGLGADPGGERSEFLGLVQRAALVLR